MLRRGGVLTPSGFGEAFVAHLRGWLAVLEVADEVAQRIREDVIAAGSRVVDGGQVGTAPDGRLIVEYRDDASGAVLFRGVVESASRGWEDDWFHVDHLSGKLPLPHYEADPDLPSAVREFLNGCKESLVEMDVAGLRRLLGEVSA